MAKKAKKVNFKVRCEIEWKKAFNIVAGRHGKNESEFLRDIIWNLLISEGFTPEQLGAPNSNPPGAKSDVHVEEGKALDKFHRKRPAAK